MMVYSSLPTLPAAGLRREIDRMFGDVFGRDPVVRSTWTPVVDVHEDKAGYTFEAEVAGIEPSDIEVTADKGILTIRGQRAAGEQREDGRWHVSERMYGSFVRTFQLPETIDETRIEASFANGLLTVRVPKAAVPEPKRIEVRTAK